MTATKLAMTNAVKTVVIVSHDNDLLPAIETIIGKTKCHVEVAAWAGCNRLTIDKERRSRSACMNAKA